MQEAFDYCEVFLGRFEAEERGRVIALHQGTGALQSRMPRGDGAFIRDSDLFWVPRMAETEWIFARIWRSPPSVFRDTGLSFSKTWVSCS